MDTPICVNCGEEIEDQSVIDRDGKWHHHHCWMAYLHRCLGELEEANGRLAAITQAVEEFRQYAVKHSLMIGEIVAWNKIKKLTIHYLKPLHITE